MCKERGQAYRTMSGKQIDSKECKDLDSCRAKCNERFTKEECLTIFENYWKLENYDLRRSYIAGLITPQEKSVTRKRSDDPSKQISRTVSFKYFLEINSERRPICQKHFLCVFGETKSFLEGLQNNKLKCSTGVIATDQRGKGSNKRKWSDIVIQEVDDHINSFPHYESHYGRDHSSKKYLSSSLTLAKMYELYKEGRESAVSRRIYEERFHKTNLSFKHPKIDTCNKCDTFKLQIDLAKTEQSKQELIAQKNLHHANYAEKAYDSKRKDKIESKGAPNHKTFTFDLQQCLPTPFLQSGVAFYKRQLWTYNLTIHDCETKDAYCCMWFETIANRGANQIASCLFQFLSTLPQEITHITFYSDTCSGQNKNSHVAAMFMVALQKFPWIEVINHKFLVPGHTHMECDSDHSVIERLKRKTSMNVHHPRDWFQLVRSAGKRFIVYEMQQNNFYNFCDLYKNQLIRKKKNNDNSLFQWSKCQWLQYKKPVGVLQYKENLEEDEDFFSVDFRRRGKEDGQLVINQEYTAPLPINKEKKKDIISLFPLIEPAFHEFYLSIPTSDSVRATFDPDLNELDDD